MLWHSSIDSLIGIDNFFEICSCSVARHFPTKASRGTQANYFTIDDAQCSKASCLECANAEVTKAQSCHRPICVVQVRRSSHQNCISLEDLAKEWPGVEDGIQRYTINSGQVVFLRRRETRYHPRTTGSSCVVCSRALKDEALYCCLECKSVHLSRGSPGTGGVATSSGSSQEADDSWQMPAANSWSTQGSADEDAYRLVWSHRAARSPVQDRPRRRKQPRPSKSPY